MIDTVDGSDPQVAVVDYEMGNIFSVARACQHAGLRPLVTADAAAMMGSAALILPGVGAFGDAMENLTRFDLVAPIKDFIESGRPFMGICLGMQLLLTESEEFGRHKGLDIIEGTVVRFPPVDREQRSIKVPQVGWNRIHRPDDVSGRDWQNSPLVNIANHEYMYFVHSYYPVPDDPETILSVTRYEGCEYASSIWSKNIFACQYHPEKSAVAGMTIYGNFAARVKQGKWGHEERTGD